MRRNKHREAAKMRRQRNMAQMEEQNKTPGENLNEMEIEQPIRCTVQNIGYQDAPGTHWVLQQHKKDPGRN